MWNVEALAASKEIILCEALIDAATFWCAGYRNVTAAYGVEGFTDDQPPLDDADLHARGAHEVKGDPHRHTSGQA